VIKVHEYTRLNFAGSLRLITRSVCAVAAFSTFAGSVANAQAFLLAPTRLIFEGNVRSQQLTIMNQTDKPQTYRLRLEDRLQKENGEFDVISDPADPTAASSFLRLSARQVSIPPQESATIRVLLRRPATAAAGEVRSHLIVTELPTVGQPSMDSDAGEGISVRINTIYGISIPILVRTGQTNAQLSISNIVREPDVGNPALDTIKLKLSIVGNRSYFVDLRLVSPRQRRSPPIFQAKAVSVYTPVNARLMTLSLDAETTAKVRQGGYVLQYQEVNKDGVPMGPSAEIAF
jgi:hypothetical protein